MQCVSAQLPSCNTQKRTPTHLHSPAHPPGIEAIRLVCGCNTPNQICSCVGWHAAVFVCRCATRWHWRTMQIILQQAASPMSWWQLLTLPYSQASPGAQRSSHPYLHWPANFARSDVHTVCLSLQDTTRKSGIVCLLNCHWYMSSASTSGTCFCLLLESVTSSSRVYRNVHVRSGFEWVGIHCTCAFCVLGNPIDILPKQYLVPCRHNTNVVCAAGEEPWLPAYMPNVMYQDTHAAAAGRSVEQVAAIKGLAFVAVRHIQDEEILLNYRLNPQVQKPEWYTPVDVEEDRRRWY